MTKNRLFVVSALFLIIAVLLPVILKTSDESAIDVIDHIGVLIAAFCGVIAIWVAILLYDKYGVDKAITDKNLKIVLEIVEELKKTHVFANCDSAGTAYFMRLDFWNTDLSSFDQTERFLDDRVYFSLNYVYAFERLYDLGRDPFTPKNIADAINLIQLNILPELTDEDKQTRYAVISANKREYDNIEDVTGKFNGKDMTLREYIQNYLKVKESVKTWLTTHNVEEKSLNF